MRRQRQRSLLLSTASYLWLGPIAQQLAETAEVTATALSDVVTTAGIRGERLFWRFGCFGQWGSVAVTPLPLPYPPSPTRLGLHGASLAGARCAGGRSAVVRSAAWREITVGSSVWATIAAGAAGLPSGAAVELEAVAAESAENAKAAINVGSVAADANAMEAILDKTVVYGGESTWPIDFHLAYRF
uniref:Uncharacterized protein n=1 Tax=Sphaerodactylus townsendi TaxID=933632 RepID=A0ACB8F5H3_9SAUR